MVAALKTWDGISSGQCSGGDWYSRTGSSRPFSSFSTRAFLYCDHSWGRENRTRCSPPMIHIVSVMFFREELAFPDQRQGLSPLGRLGVYERAHPEQGPRRLDHGQVEGDQRHRGG